MEQVSKDGGQRAALRLVEIEGEKSLVDRLGEPVRRALSGRGAFYRVHIDGVGRCGEVVVRITGAKGRLPLLFDRGELEPGYVVSVVRSTADKYGF